ncbi:peptidyl-prolyl cis-trans isomerase [Erythrobacter sp. SDW2]|uniref:peptidylprolyl isomerase n=1 Tax=Erythrobacter sp. SDW2 TaxID=2907154 RepID=UPI001F25499D|nr:peptidylprolyl isomerase [Erythrobacter sp. SDW2]UIP06862.1 peptidyl-prolyl cis-trans isomerase [Erythrobacter sp. SDW2]
MVLADRLRTVLREPLVHFLIGGALIFAFFAWRGEEADPASRVIDVTREVQAQIALDYERSMQRPPTDAELAALTERWVREEVLYREALRLGFDAGDPVVRRRLAKKMDFLATSSAEAAEPSEAELEQWYRTNAARYASDLRLSFDQVYFAARPDAGAVLPGLRRDWQGAGEPASLPDSVEAREKAQVAAQFGADFASKLVSMTPDGRWQGPIASGVGWHFVRLRKMEPGRVPELAASRQRVIEDWRLATAREREEAAYRLLREAYTVKIEK